MTLIVCTTVPTGVAMAADSRTIVRDAQGQAAISTDYAEKLFAIGDCIAGTTGRASFGGKTISEHIADISAAQPGAALLSTASDAARHLGTYFLTKYLEDIARNPQAALKNGEIVVEFLVGGKDGNPHQWSCVRVTVRHQSIAPAPQPAEHGADAKATGEGAEAAQPLPAKVVETATVNVSPPQTSASSWAGMGDCLRRLLNGYDGARINVNSQMQALLRGTAPIIPYPTFTMQDAANFRDFLLKPQL